MNISMQQSKFFTINILRGGDLKSTREKMQRQNERDRQISLLETQKSALKGQECDTLDEIADKLDMLHSYDEQIAAARQKYNSEQMLHVMDEAKERAEKAARTAEKYEPKTPEERREEEREETLGLDTADNGILDELDNLEAVDAAAAEPETVNVESIDDIELEEITTEAANDGTLNLHSRHHLDFYA